MEQVEIDFIERFGLIFEEDGLPKISGRIFGLLLLSEAPMALDDLSDTLQVSKASISTNTRMLDRMGMVDRTSKPGDRRTFYRLSPDAFERSFDRAKERMITVAKLIESTAPHLPEERAIVRKRLDWMHDWNLFLVGEMDALIERWKEQRKQRPPVKGDLE